MSISVNQRYRDRRTAGLRIAQVEDQTGLPLDEATRGFTSPPVFIRLEKLGPGRWLVRDAEGNRGGLFRDYASAMKFVRREFAASQPTVVEMLLA